MRAADSALTRLRPHWQGYWPQADLNAIADDVRDRFALALTAWRLDDVRPLPGGFVALVCAGRLDGQAVVLKISPRGHPDTGQLAAEGDALEFWQPSAVVPRLLDRRDDGLTILMEYVQPGGTVEASGAPWPDALTLVGELAARLHAVGRPPEGFVTAREYTDSWRLEFGDRPDLAGELDELVTPGAGDVLIHADLHPGNVLRGGHGWKVIDPHAVCAEPAADIWALLDPLVISLPEEPAAAIGEAWERVQRYAEAAGIDGVRAAAWTRLRGLAEASSIDGRAGVSAEDRAWAARLRRMAEALA